MTTIEYREVVDDEEFCTRAATTEDGVKSLEGYAIRFGVWSLDLGGFKERIAAVAVEKTLGRNGKRNDIYALHNHDSSKVLGNTRAGTLVLTPDERGLHDKIAMPDTSYANDLLVSVGRRDVRGQSFGMSVPKGGDEWNSDFTERQVNELRLHEVSVVTFPAYPQTSISARSLAMFAAATGTERDELAEAFEALRSGVELTDEYRDLLVEAVHRSRTEPDEATEVVRAIEDATEDTEAIDLAQRAALADHFALIERKHSLQLASL